MSSSYQTSRAAWQGWPLPATEGLRYQLASALLSASALLLHVAVRLQHTPAAAKPAPAAPRAEPLLEYYAEAGAPEGALYVDGELAGWIPGVSRL